jgi:hypothetical protein
MIERIDWNLRPCISFTERKTILAGLQAWQLGETSDGCNLLKASGNYAAKIVDPAYIKAVKLFIKEEQKHGENLGKYLDRIGEERIKKDWGDSLFRKFRYLNNSMEMWTLTVITVESAAQLFYQSLKDATGCKLLKQICTDILIDEAAHIEFQRERLRIILESRSIAMQGVFLYWYKLFYFSTALVVWLAHRKVFRAGGNTFKKFMHKMSLKFRRNIEHFKTQKLAPVSFIKSDK